MTREEIIAVTAAFIVITIMFTIRTCILDAKVEKVFELLDMKKFQNNKEESESEECDKEDWMFILSGARVIENCIDRVSSSGYINPVDLRTLDKTIGCIVKRAEKYCGRDS